MSKAKRAKGHSSKVLASVFENISAADQERTENKMLLAAKIDEGRKAMGWSQNEFAEQMGKQPSEISKWLSGTHNFTSDTLWDIEDKLGIELISINMPTLQVAKASVYSISVSCKSRPSFAEKCEPVYGMHFYHDDVLDKIFNHG